MSVTSSVQKESSFRPAGRSRNRRTLTALGLCGVFGLGCTPLPDEPPIESLRQGLSVTLPDCLATSLVSAIAAANAAGAGPHSITLKGGCTYTLTAPDNYWYGPNGLPPIASNITIDGGQQGAIIERSSEAATPSFRLFYVAGAPTPTALIAPGTLALKNLTLRGGLARGGNGGAGGGGGMGAGGAIFAQGDLTLLNVTLSGNQAVGGFAGNGTGGGGGGGMGGNGGTTAGSDGGGGGMKGDGASGTSTEGGKGGDGPIAGSGGGGAQINVAGTGGITPGTEDGGAASETMGGLGGGSRLLGGDAGGLGELAGDGGGGGQYDTTQCNSGGGAGFGGKGGSGIANMVGGGGGGGGFGGGGGGGTVRGTGGGGGVGGGGGGYRGGGGFGGGGAAGTIGGSGGFGGGGGGGGGSGGFGAGNGNSSATRGGGGSGMGGAVFSMYGTFTAVNTTLTGNTASGGSASLIANVGKGLGGAIFSLNGITSLTHCTVAGNTVSNGIAAGNTAVADQNGSAVYVVSWRKNATASADATASLTLANTLLADGSVGATGQDLALVINRTSGAASVTATAANLVESRAELGGASFTGTPTVADPKLDTLKDNGGPVWTLASLQGSPAIGSGELTTCASAPVASKDARGRSRSKAICDLGAFETSRTLPDGQSCADASDCTSGFCTDGVCCDTACGGGDPTDCGSCRGAETGGRDGTCAAIAKASAVVCRAAAGSCDVAELCDGQSLVCPADQLAAEGMTCQSQEGAEPVSGMCSGTSADCSTEPAVSGTSTGCTVSAPHGASSTSAAWVATVLLLLTALRRRLS